MDQYIYTLDEVRGLLVFSESKIELNIFDEEIINMSWLCDNVIGTIPSFEQLTEHAQETVKANGMPIISNLSGDKNESTSNC